MFSGDIGGSIGLFVGASVLTAFEIIDVFLHNVLKIHLKRHKKNNRRPEIGKDRLNLEGAHLTNNHNKDMYEMS